MQLISNKETISCFKLYIFFKNLLNSNSFEKIFKRFNERLIEHKELLNISRINIKVYDLKMKHD